MDSSNNVKELSQLWELENIYEEHLKQKGFKASFISHWDPNASYRHKIAEKVVFPDKLPFIGYNYSKRITKKFDLLKTIGIEEDLDVTLSPNGTISLNIVFNFLKNQNITKIISLTPSYYVINNLAKINDIPIYNISWIKTNNMNNYELPTLLNNKIDENAVIYIINPIYSTGSYLENHLNEFTTILEKNPWIILDESLSLRNKSIMKYFVGYPKIISIHSPHKTICVNAYKFSFIVHNKKYNYNFEQLTDVIYGGLSRENISAMEHYLSDNFEEVENYIIDETEKNKNIILGCLDSCSECFDKNTNGHFISLYYPHLNAEIGKNMILLKDMVFHSGTSFIPNIRNNVDENNSFSYRVNLLRINDKSLGGIIRLHSYLTSIN